MSGVMPFPAAKHVIFRRATDGYLLTVVEERRHLKFTDSPSTDHAVQFALAPETYPNDGLYSIRSRLTNNLLFCDPSSDQIRADVVENAIEPLNDKFDFERPKDQTLQPNLLKNLGNNYYCGTPASGPEKDCLFADLPDAGNAVLVVVEDVQEVIFQRVSDGYFLTVIENELKEQHLKFLERPRNDIAVRFTLQPSFDFVKNSDSESFTIRSLLTNKLLIPDSSGRIRADIANIMEPDEAKFALERTEDLIIPPKGFLLKHVSNNCCCWTLAAGPEKDYLYANVPNVVKLALLILPDSN